MNNKIIVLVGPTAVGKTYVAVKLSQMLKTEVISADSMQIYKEMNIGTAKVTEKEADGIKHHMIDIISPDENYSVSEFKEQSENIIDDLLNENKTPVIVGGSGLYVNSLIYDLDFSQAEGNEEIRKHYMEIYNKQGEDVLFEILEKTDPESASKIHKNNVKRVIRALEVYDLTGRKFSDTNTNIRKTSDKYNFILIGLNMDRAVLYERINKRVDKMIDEGLIDEVQNLLSKGYTEDLVSMKGIGYKEIIDYLNGNMTLDEAVEILKRNTRRFAKRQFTWFNRDKNVKWFNIATVETIDLTVDNIYNYISEK